MTLSGLEPATFLGYVENYGEPISTLPHNKREWSMFLHTQDSISTFYNCLQAKYDFPQDGKCILSSFINMQAWCYCVCTLACTVAGASGKALLLLQVTTIQKLHSSSSVRTTLSVLTNGRTRLHPLASYKVQIPPRFYNMKYYIIRK